jgi:hypothetical protein
MAAAECGVILGIAFGGARRIVSVDVRGVQLCRTERSTARGASDPGRHPCCMIADHLDGSLVAPEDRGRCVGYFDELLTQHPSTA